MKDIIETIERNINRYTDRLGNGFITFDNLSNGNSAIYSARLKVNEIALRFANAEGVDKRDF
jgi:hypothetical protein